MRHLKNKKTLDRNTAQRKSLMRNLATSLVLHEKIRTTNAKAKVLKSVVERLVTISKKGDLASRRRLIAYLTVERAAKKMMEVFGARYAERAGGFTRLTKVGTRPGDRASMVDIEFI